jgi:hypothetical protein
MEGRVGSILKVTVVCWSCCAWSLCWLKRLWSLCNGVEMLKAETFGRCDNVKFYGT